MGRLPKISEAEWDVMNVVWDRAPVTAQDVYDQLADRKDWSLRTVKTLLGRLVKKRALAFEVDGRRYRYAPLVSRDECVTAESESFLSRVLDGSASPMLAFIVREGRLSRDDIDKLRALLDEQEKNRE